MRGRHAHRRLLKRPYRPESQLVVESLEGRIVLTASIGFDARQGVVSIMGSEAGDVATVSQQGKNVVVSLTGVTSRTFKASQVKLVDFKGLGGDDTFTNTTRIRSRVDGGLGRDTLRGGSGADDIRGGGDNDKLFGGLGDDRLYGGAGNDDVYGDGGNDSLFGEDGDDHLDGRAGRDRLVGGAGLDREDDSDDRFSDGDDDGDGYDNDHDGPVNPGLVTPITFTETAPGVSTAQLTGESTNERDKDYYSFTAAANQTLTLTVVPDANGRYAEVEVKDALTGRELLELEPSENGIATRQLAVVAGTSYVIKVNSPSDYVAVGYTVDLTLDDSPISPIIGTEVVFDSNGFAQLTGTVVGDDSKSVYSFTATSSGTLNVSILPDANGRYVELELKNRTTGRKLLELEPSRRSPRTSGSVAVVAGQTYVIEIESPSDWLAVGFTVNLQLS
jgi:hypothetical protein